MKKLLTLILLITFAVLTAAFATAACSEEALEETVNTDVLEDSLPHEAKELVGDFEKDADPMKVFTNIWAYIRENGGKYIKKSIRSAASIVLISVIVSAASGLFQEKKSFIITAGVAAISAAAVTDAASFILMGQNTLTELSAFSKALLPCIAAAEASSGAITSAAAKCALSVLFIDILITAGEKLVIPIVYAYMAAGIGGAAIGGDGLDSAAAFLKWLAVTLLTLIVIVFTLFLSVTGIVTGSTDAVVLRLARTTISTALPVVGGIVSDAAGAITAGAAVLKNAVGVFGMAAVIAVCITPFLRIGTVYLTYKGAAGLAVTVSDKRISKLLSSLGTSFGLILGLIGACAVMLFVSVIIAMRAVS